MTMDRHEPFEELISASLRGDLSADERVRLDAHLDTCAECRATLAAFADQRRIVAGLRHVAPPADLGARVRAGIEGGSTVGIPWWRRPTTIFAAAGGGLAVVAGALLAIVLLNGTTDRPIGDASPTPTGTASFSAAPSASAPAPSASMVESAAPSPEPEPTATPIPASPEPDVYIAVSGPVENRQMSIRDGTTGDTITDAVAPSGPVVAAALSPGGQWLAYISALGESGLHEVRATLVADDPDSPFVVGDTVDLGQSVAGSPFLEQMSWSDDGSTLAFTLADQKDETTDAWVFRPSVGEAERLTDVGNAYAGSWVPGTSVLWVSTAGETPSSYLVAFDPEAGSIAAADPADSEFPPAENIFQPLVSPNGAFVIFWSGVMEQSGSEWLFVQGGAPWLAENQPDGERGYDFTESRLLFSDVTIRRDAFTSAAIAWGPDGDAYAVWNTAWTGVPNAYPDAQRVYFSHATDARGVTSGHAIDATDIPGGSFVVDVKVSPTGNHLVVTAGRPSAGIMDPPSADLLLVTRNTGNVSDEVAVIGSAEEGWFGPAGFDAFNEAETP
ncbi:MAG TPA: zf-HC2 domain-containing protein [Candidatus Limnocylindria bacterium]|nr:zf-HC2 domain-containing protein [Candidatus Limnocylindria bacterium]